MSDLLNRKRGGLRRLEGFTLSAGIALCLALLATQAAALFLHSRVGLTPRDFWLLQAVSLAILAIEALWLRRLRRAQHRQNLAVLEIAAQTSTEIVAAIGRGGEVWTRLPWAACTVTSASISGVAILEPDAKACRVLSVWGIDPGFVGSRLLLAEHPRVAQVLDTGQSLALRDVRESYSQNPALKPRLPEFRAMLLIPLVAGDRRLGVMMLADREPRDFSDSEIHLAELWAKLASIAVANDALYEQTRQAMEAQRRMLQQRDALFELNQLIVRSPSLDEILQKIVDLAPPLLQIDVCVLSMTTEDPHEVVVRAASKPYSERIANYRFRTEESLAGLVVREGRTLIVPDGAKSHRNPYLMSVIPCESILIVPLLDGRGKVMGAISLCRGTKGDFSEDQVRITETFASRAAIAIDNAQLKEQALHDAQTKAMLLRELNHRGKNNLAGIVALLTMRQPPLDRNARRWLDRAVERIRNLARTHDLLSAGTSRVGLPELVKQTIESLAVIRPPGIKVISDLCPTRVSIRADRAVNLAMVLHELCSNALLHGGIEDGILTVASSVENGNLRLDVIDHGVGVEDGESLASADTSAGRDQPVDDGRALATLSSIHSGLGLVLVRGFTERELRGTFQLSTTPGGGTTASVVFPLLEDEHSSQRL